MIRSLPTNSFAPLSTTPGEGPSKTTRLLRIALLVALTTALLLAQPAAAEETNPICQDDSNILIEVIEGFVHITTAIGVMGLMLVWQGDSLMEMVTLNPETNAKFKHHKMQAMKSAGTLVLLGPLFTIAGSVMNLPIAECVSLSPF